MGKASKKKKVSKKSKTKVNRMAIDILCSGKNEPNHSGDVEQTEDSGKKTTRGSLLQRHKREWKLVRNQIEALRNENAKLSKSDVTQKMKKKQIVKEIHALKQQMQDRQAEELKRFDEQQKEPVMDLEGPRHDQ
eukprot:TRINITY_DN16602_c0_g1_i1.p1 TRINITY_DN16602_c0_g1~~TRINITY_DN16602_c0_g1_i1.p1  ORF type:complete len:134 (+),score=40.91 TRINITY_DN16602_c0_g1_i1:127-528(+)